MSSILNSSNKLCWVRQIEIRLSSKLTKKKIVFGGKDSNQLDIKINGTKYLSAVKDKGTATIANLTYSQIYQLITGQYFTIEIWAGYRTQSLQCYFKGEVAFISDKIRERRDNECYIIFASQMVAAYSQSRMNLSLKSGINLYAAFRYICLTKGIDTSHLSESLKKQFIQEVIQNYDKPSNLAEMIASNTSTFTLDTDSSIDGNGVINCSDLSNKRQIRINPNTINFSKGNPTLDKDGLKITILPTFCFKPGDIILIDNAIIDTSISNAENVNSTFNSYYLDSQGAYMIIELDYNFENRGPTFEINIKARSLDIIKNIIGY